LDVEFALHEGTEGPGSAWARQAKVGNQVLITGPGGPYRIAEEADWFLVTGDHAALPAIATILETLPPSASTEVMVEVEGPEDEITLAGPKGMTVRWLHNDGGPSASGKVLESALRSVTLPGGNGRVFVACEAGVMRSIRGHLLHERGLAKESI